ncbi:hypothetical protein [Cryptosporangium aurantiacum]
MSGGLELDGVEILMPGDTLDSVVVNLSKPGRARARARPPT